MCKKHNLYNLSVIEINIYCEYLLHRVAEILSQLIQGFTIPFPKLVANFKDHLYSYIVLLFI